VSFVQVHRKIDHFELDESADRACGLHFLLVKIFGLHLSEFQIQLEFFNCGFVKVLGDTFNVLIQLLQISFHFFEIFLEFL
jgi:hypothetical protein